MTTVQLSLLVQCNMSGSYCHAGAIWQRDDSNMVTWAVGAVINVCGSILINGGTVSSPPHMHSCRQCFAMSRHAQLPQQDATG